ncbi:MAG: N-acetyltransferase family protein [Roseobacter sp.]|jgi:phosphinothricin acetyltransferase|nr:N-acetyltransferase family protein [Roseobacter sp.]
MIRPAQKSDAPDIAWLWNRMIRDTLATFTTIEKTVSDVEAIVKARQGSFWVYEAAERIAGFATFGPFRAGPGYAATCEHSVIVAPHAARSGIGSALMEALCTAARGQGLHVMVAAISSANPAAVAFHANLGFVEVGRMPQVGRKSGQFLDLILMQKMLGPVGS